MGRTEFFFEQIIKFQGYTLCVHGEDSLSVTLTKDTCPILRFDFFTDLANPKNPKNKPWKSSKLVCKNKNGNLCLDLRGKRIEKMILRIPWNIINDIMEGVTEYFVSSPDGLIKSFVISASDSDDKDFSCEYSIISRKGYEHTSYGSFGGKNKISLWMCYFNPGEKYSLKDEKVLVKEIISFCKKTILSETEEYKKIVARDLARSNYVHSEHDEKVFLFSDCNSRCAITENGRIIFSGVTTFWDSAGNFYESNIRDMKKNLAEDHWQLLPVVATADNDEAIKVLECAIEKSDDFHLSALRNIKNYLMKAKV